MDLIVHKSGVKLEVLRRWTHMVGRAEERLEYHGQTDGVVEPKVLGDAER